MCFPDPLVPLCPPVIMLCCDPERPEVIRKTSSIAFPACFFLHLGPPYLHQRDSFHITKTNKDASVTFCHKILCIPNVTELSRPIIPILHTAAFTDTSNATSKSQTITKIKSHFIPFDLFLICHHNQRVTEAPFLKAHKCFRLQIQLAQ